MRRWIAVAVGAALAGCSGGGSVSVSAPTGASTPTTPTPPPSFTGGWSGTTSQGRLMNFLVTDAGIPVFMASTSVAGTLCTSTVTTYLARTGTDAPHALNAGAFSVTSTGSSGTITIGGTLLASGSGSGTLAVNDTRCNGTLNGTWTASKAAGPEVNLTGAWVATFASSLVSRTTGGITLVQTGAALVGTYSLPNGAQGTISGTVSGRMGTMNLLQTTAGCAGAFTGYAAVMPSPEVLTYFYAGADCLGTHTGGNGSATR